MDPLLGLRMLAGRIGNMLARGRVRSVNSAGKSQVLQLDLLAGETKDRMEHLEPYGFTSAPKPGAEALAAFLDGDRSHGVVLVVADRRYRLQSLVAGEVAIFDDQGQKIHLTRAGIVIDGGGKPLTIQNAPTVSITATAVNITSAAVNVVGNLQVTGNFQYSGSGSNAGKNIGSTHTHGGVTAGQANTTVPN